MRPQGGLVYSTDAGTMCPVCRQPLARCACQQPQAGAADSVVRVSRETKGRGGKGVTLVRGLGLEPMALARLARELKAVCGSGGTVKDGVIEIQGDHRDKLVEYLRGSDAVRARSVKSAGG